MLVDMRAVVEFQMFLWGCILRTGWFAKKLGRVENGLAPFYTQGSVNKSCVFFWTRKPYAFRDSSCVTEPKSQVLLSNDSGRDCSNCHLTVSHIIVPAVRFENGRFFWTAFRMFE